MISKNKSRGRGILIPILLTVTVLSSCVTIWALYFRQSDPVLAPDYAPVSEEKHAQAIPDDSADADTAQPGSGSVRLTYSDQVSVNLNSRSAGLLFANPGKSNQDMVLQVVIQGAVILQSGRIEPGKQVTHLDLSDSAAALLQPGGYEGSFQIYYYHPDSGEKAMVSTEVPITVTVTP
jgi:hypothetical protein